MKTPPVLRVGVDLGGTKTEAVVLRLPDAEDAAEPDVLVRARIATERDAGYDAIVARTARLVDDVVAQAGLRERPKVGVGMPGAVDRRGLVKNSNTTCLNGRPFRQDLEAALGAPVAFANDANCFAVAEATWGAARGARVAFGVILGTGVGGGIVVREPSGRARAWDGHQGCAGEWGHIPLEPVTGKPCYCGRRGCLEMFVSGPALEEAFAEQTGERLSVAQISARRDPVALRFWSERVGLFGRALGAVVNLLDPDVVVLGGGVSNVEAFYTLGPAETARWVFGDELSTPIVKHALGDSAGVLGAALLP